MKFLFSALLLASSVASAEAVTDWNAMPMNCSGNASDTHNRMKCTPQLYNCGTYWEEVDFCANGSYYLRGTDIPVRCDRHGGG